LAPLCFATFHSLILFFVSPIAFMRPFLRSLLLLLAWGTWLSPGNVQAQGTAFSCDGVFYQIRLVNNTSQIFKVDRSTANYSTTPLNIIGGTSNDLGVSINGLAYNPQDGYMYGLSTPGNSAAIPTSVSLYKIGMGGIINLGVVKVGTANLQLIVASGTFDKTGNYYFSSQNTGTADNNLYTINIPSNPLAATAKAFSATSTFYDIAYNPIDNFLYGVNWVGSLFKIDQATATVTTIAPATTQTTSQAVGTLFFDVSGTLFAYNNGTVGTANSATFYQVDLTDGSYTPISSISPASVSDGASCINPDQRIDVTKELTNVVAVNSTTFDITYTIRVRNSATATDDFVQVSDLLFGTTAATKANTTFPTASSVTVQGVPVVTNLDGSGLTANTSFTGVSGNASLLDGTHGLTASQRAAITYTVRVVYASGSVPNATTSQNNTAYATSTSASPNRGYIQASDGTLLTPNDLEANDASTNSNDYPALRLTRTDTPSPTPVTFAPSISGTVFEDVNYGGGLGRSRLTSTGISRNGARVELYTVTGVVATYATSTTTDINGNYSFTGLNAGTSYVVRVVNSSVTSSRGTGGVAVQTYRTTVTAANGTTSDLNRVGGEVPSQADASNGTIGTTLGGLALANTPAESQAPVSFATVASPAVNVDFGYNFDVIVNNNDAGQGSFRQFIANSNALGGETSLAQVYTPTTGATTVLRPGVETSIFMIPNGTAVAGQRAGLTNEFATTTGTSTATTITLNSTITGGITGPLTVIDGSTQTRSTGNTNAAVATTGSESTGPEVIINFGSTDGLTTTAASTSLLNMGLTGATPAGGSNTAAFSIFNTGATNAVVQNNTFYSNGANLRINGVGGANISNNISRNALSTNSDGIEVTSSSNNTIAGNQFLNNAGFGIDFIQGTSTGNNISGNTFSRNGQNTDD
jgi:parallel beta-helix repeat protein